MFLNHSQGNCEFLVVFLSRLTADGKYPVRDCENLQLPIQMQLSEKAKAFSRLLFDFLNLHEILNILKKRMIVIANGFPKLQTVKILLRPLSKKRCYRTCFESQHVKAHKIRPKYFKMSMRELLSCFSIILKKVDLENVSPSVS